MGGFKIPVDSFCSFSLLGLGQKTLRFVLLWLCSYVAIWLHGYVVVWLCGYVAMWLSGSPRFNIQTPTLNSASFLGETSELGGHEGPDRVNLGGGWVPNKHLSHPCILLPS